MEVKPRILVVDDEPQIARALQLALTSHAYDVRCASDGAAALETFREWMPDLVVTDLAMPALDGVALCRAIRAESAVPVIVLSVKGDERAKIESLDAGADDYVTKPFSMNVLLARVRAAMRRAAGPAKIDDVGVLDAGDFRVDVPGHTALVCGRPVRLTPKEFELLVFLAKRRGRVVTHEELLRSIWGAPYARRVESLRVFVGHLRKKIEPDPAAPRYLLTEPWIGYRFEPGG